MYSRETGFSNGYTAEYLRSKYAQKTAPRRSPFKSAPAAEAESVVQEETPSEKVSLSVTVPPEVESKNFLSSMESDDLLILAVLAFLLLGDRENKNFDLVLAAALLFVEFA